MRVLFTTFASRSHLNLQVPLAWALRAAGHEVCVASQPDLEDAIKDAGLTAVPVGRTLDMAGHAKSLGVLGRLPGQGAVFDIAETRREKLTWNYVRGTLTLYTTAMSGVLADDAMLDDLVEFARSWRPDLVIWDALTYVGPLVAKICGAAHARTLFGPDHFGRMRAEFHRLAAGQPAETRDDPVAEWLGGRLEPFGAEFTEDLVTGQVTVDPMPPWMQVTSGRDRLPMRFVPYGGRATFPGWVLERPKRPRVCLTLGLAAQAFGLPMPSISDLLAAVAQLDIEVIATFGTADIQSISAVPDNVRLVEFVPMDALLPTCSAIVHHFGAGTLSTATVHGVPQIRVSDDLNLWGEQGMAERLVERGAALNIAAGELTPEVLRVKLARMLVDQSFARIAVELSEETLGAPAPRELVPVLEALAGRDSGLDSPL